MNTIYTLSIVQKKGRGYKNTSYKFKCALELLDFWTDNFPDYKLEFITYGPAIEENNFQELYGFEAKREE